MPKPPEKPNHWKPSKENPAQRRPEMTPGTSVPEQAQRHAPPLIRAPSRMQISKTPMVLPKEIAQQALRTGCWVKQIGRKPFSITPSLNNSKNLVVRDGNNSILAVYTPIDGEMVRHETPEEQARREGGSGSRRSGSRKHRR